MLFAQIEPLWLELQLVIGASLLLATPLWQRVRRKHGSVKEGLLAMAREAWPVVLPLLALNIGGLALATVLELFAIALEAKMIQPIALLAVKAIGYVRRRRITSTRQPTTASLIDLDNSVALGVFAIACFAHALLSGAVKSWTLGSVAAHGSVGIVAALHLDAIASSLAAFAHLQTDERPAATLIERHAVPLGLYASNSAFLAALLLPLTIIPLLLPSSFEAWNILAPVFNSGGNAMLIKTTPEGVFSVLDLLLRLGGGLAVFALIGRLGPLRAYAFAIVVLTAVGVWEERCGSPAMLAASLLVVGIGSTLASSSPGTPMQTSTNGYTPVELDQETDMGAPMRSMTDEKVYADELVRSPRNSDGSARLSSLVAIGVGMLVLVLLRLKLSPGSYDWSAVQTDGITQWIVVETDQTPSNAVQVLCTLPDWEVVIVAGLDAPASWSHDDCHYLSVRDQQRLPFRSARNLDFHTAARRNLGHLFAIRMGATVVYDVAAGAIPLDKPVVVDPAAEQAILAYSATSETTMDVRQHLQLGDTSASTDRNHLRYLDGAIARSSLNGRALVQQQIALPTSSEACEDAPVVKLARGLHVDVAGSGSLWHRDAFWGLLLSIEASEVTRMAWSERLLWDMGGVLSFNTYRAAPSALSAVNASSSLVPTEVASYLQHWSSDAATLPLRASALLRDMTKARFVSRDEERRLKRWLADLKSLGYTFPDLTSWSRDAAVAEARASIPSADVTTRLDWSRLKCDPRGKPVYGQALLVVVFNTPFYSLIPTYERLFGQFFPNIVYYGPQGHPEEHPKVTLVDIGYGQLGFRALEHAVANNPGYASYIYTNDDVALNPYALSTLDLDRFWLSQAFIDGFGDSWSSGEFPLNSTTEDGYHWWVWYRPDMVVQWEKAFDSLPQASQDRAIAASRTKTKTAYGGQNDFFHLPGRLTTEFMQLLKPFSVNDVWHEAVFHTIVRTFPESEDAFNIPDTGAKWAWHGDRENWRASLVPTTYVYHPMKMSKPENQLALEQWLIDSSRWWRRGAINQSIQ